MQSGEEWVDEADFLVGDERERKRDDKADGG